MREPGHRCFDIVVCLCVCARVRVCVPGTQGTDGDAAAATPARVVASAKQAHNTLLLLTCVRPPVHALRHVQPTRRSRHVH